MYLVAIFIIQSLSLGRARVSPQMIIYLCNTSSALASCSSADSRLQTDSSQLCQLQPRLQTGQAGVWCIFHHFEFLLFLSFSRSQFSRSSLLASMNANVVSSLQLPNQSFRNVKSIANITWILPPHVKLSRTITRNLVILPRPLAADDK